MLVLVGDLSKATASLSHRGLLPSCHRIGADVCAIEMLRTIELNADATPASRGDEEQNEPPLHHYIGGCIIQ